jgi:hypothetical protein
VKFAWDPGKAGQNFAKHGVSFDEARVVFRDPLSFTFDDTEHSVGEHQFLTIGYSSDGTLLVVAHIDDGETIRIISARQATPRERRRHET